MIEITFMWIQSCTVVRVNSLLAKDVRFNAEISVPILTESSFSNHVILVCKIYMSGFQCHFREVQDKYYVGSACYILYCRSGYGNNLQCVSTGKSTGKSQRCRASNNSEVFDVCTWDVSKVTFCDEKSERVFSRRSLARKESESRCCWQEFYGTVHIAKC